MAEVRLEIIADSKGAVKEIRSVAGETEKLDKKSGALKRSLADLKKSGFAPAIEGITGFRLGALGLAGVVGGVGLGIAKATKDTIALGTQLADLSSKTGLSTTALQEFKFAGEQAGVGMQTITDSVLRLGRRAAAELPEAEKGLKAIGLTVDDIISTDPASAFELVVKRLEAMGPGARQAAASMQIFGDAGLQVLPAINQGLQGNIERFRDLNATIDEETIQAAKKLGDELTDLNAKWTRMKTIIGGAVIPVLNDFAEAVEDTSESTGGFLDKVLEGFESMRALANVALKPTEQAIRDQGVAIEDILEPLKKFEDTIKRVPVRPDPFNETADGVKNLEEITRDQNKAIAEAVREYEKQRRAAEELQKPIENLANSSLRQLVFTLKDIPPQIAIVNEATQKYGDLLPIVTERVGGLSKGVAENTNQTSETVDVTREWSDILSETRGIFNVLGIDAESTAGKILNAFSSVFDMFNGILGIVSRIGGLFGGGGLNLGAIFGGAGTTGQAARAGGFSLGGLFGGGLGSILGIGGLVGAGAFGLTKLFGSLFGGPSPGERAGQDVFRDFGVRLSEGLAQAIGELGGNDDIRRASQLALGGIISEGLAQGVNLDLLTERIVDTFSFLERGEISAAEAQRVLNESVSQLIPIMDQLGSAGVQQLERLISASELFGVTFEGIDQIAEFLGRTISTELPAEVEAGLSRAGAEVDRFGGKLEAALGRLGRARDFSFNFRDFEVAPGAQMGTDFIATRPTLLPLAEQGIPERVVVQPLNRPGFGGVRRFQFDINVDVRGTALSSAEAARFREQLRAPIADVVRAAIRGGDLTKEDFQKVT